MQVHFKGWECNLEFSKYSNGRTAITLIDAKTNEPIAKATINIPEVPLFPDEVIIKDHDENEGMVAALIKAGIIIQPFDRCKSGYSTYQMCSLVNGLWDVPLSNLE